MELKILSCLILTSLTSPAFASFVSQKVIVGSEHTCALSLDGKVKCWGDNSSGQLGVGSNVRHGELPDTMGKNLPVVNLGSNVVAKDICAGRGYSCALTSDGRVKCWGGAGNGSLGQGRRISVGSDPSQMGDALPYTDLGADFKVSSLACGEYHSCAINQEGKAKCWGSNGSGQLGIESNATLGLKPDDMGDHLPFVMIDQKIKQMSLGARFSCALVSDGSIKCWGENTYGNAGIETTESHGAIKGSMANLISVKLENGPYVGLSISSSYVHSCATYLYQGRKKFKCWGYNGSDTGRVGVGSKSDYIGEKPDSMGDKLLEVQIGIDSISDFKALGTFTCALAIGGKLKCWGHNSQGQLGLGDMGSYTNSPGTSGTNLPYVDVGLPVKSLSSGSASNHSCVILINSLIKCWGINGQGQLGYEDSQERGSHPGEMGDDLPYVHLD